MSDSINKINLQCIRRTDVRKQTDSAKRIERDDNINIDRGHAWLFHMTLDCLAINSVDSCLQCNSGRLRSTPSVRSSLCRISCVTLI